MSKDGKTFIGTACYRHKNLSDSCERYASNGDCVRGTIERVDRQRADPIKRKRLSAKANRRVKFRSKTDKAFVINRRLVTRAYKNTPLAKARRSASDHIRNDVKRSHQKFQSKLERVKSLRLLAEVYLNYKTPSRCEVPNCGVPAEEWDEVIFGLGHRPDNIGRLCIRHNRIKRDASLADLEGLVMYVKGKANGSK